MDLRELLSFPSLGTPTRNPEGTPSIYASKEEWQAYRAKQAADVVAAARVTNAASDVRSVDNQIESDALDAAMRELAAQVPTPSYYAGSDSDSPSAKAVAAAGAGRGFVNPPNVTPAEDPGQSFINAAFPEVFQKQPPSGKVNTKGGVERVNARTAEHGVTAVVGKDGKITMTNLNPDGTVNKGTGSPNSILGDGRGQRAAVVAPNTPLAINATLDKLQRASPDEARGLMADLTTSIAQAEAALTAEALKFGANKFGVPALEQQLLETQAADKKSVGWYPGIGDSPITQKVRTQLESANTAARQAASEYLKTNVNAAALSAAKENAAATFKRIERSDISADTLKTNLRIRAQEKKLTKQEQDAETAANLSPKALERIAILHPVSRGNPTEMGDWYNQKFKTTKGSIEKILDASGAELVTYAMERDPYALSIITAEETRNDPTQTEEKINMRLNRIKQLADAPDFPKKAAAFRAASSGLQGDALKQAERELNQALALGKTSLGGDKKEQQRQRYEIALEMERAAQTTAVEDDMRNIFSAEGPMGAAIAEAIKVTGAASLPAVFTAFVGSASKEEQQPRITLFTDFVDKAVQKHGTSIFGMPDINKLKASIINATIQLRRESAYPRSSSPFVLG